MLSLYTDSAELGVVGHDSSATSVFLDFRKSSSLKIVDLRTYVHQEDIQVYLSAGDSVVLILDELHKQKGFTFPLLNMTTYTDVRLPPLQKGEYNPRCIQLCTPLDGHNHLRLIVS